MTKAFEGAEGLEGAASIVGVIKDNIAAIAVFLKAIGRI
jgi:hypothetical protein